MSYRGQITRQAIISIIKKQIGAWTVLLTVQPPRHPRRLYLHYDCYVRGEDGEPTVDDEGKKIKTGCDAFTVGIDGAAQTTVGDIGSAHYETKWLAMTQKVSIKIGTAMPATGMEITQSTLTKLREPAFFSGWKDANDQGTSALKCGFNGSMMLRSPRQYGSRDITLGGIESVLPVHITAEGLDLQQLTQKFLLGAVNFSQGTDDYLDDDIDGVD